MTVLQQALQKIWRGGALTGDDLIALGLLLAMVASLSHLITMLATRWGDRHIAFKSLLGSLLVHAVCFLGLEVFEPLNTANALTAADSAEPPEVVTQILVQSEDEVAASESGNTPIPDQTTPPQVTLQRLPQDTRLMEVPDVPERQPENLDSLQTDVDDVSPRQQPENPAAALRIDSGREAPRVAAANDSAAELQTLVEQSKADVAVPSTQRVRTERGDVRPDVDMPQRRRLSQGSAQQIATEIVAADVSTATTTGDLPTAIPIPNTDDAPAIERKAAPVTTPDPLEAAGATTETSLARTMPSRSFESRLQRQSQSLRSIDPGQRPVRQTSQTPQTPIPLTADYDEVRIGRTQLNITDALQSAASLVDANRDDVRRRESRPATYQLRDIESRQDAAAKFGGTSESEAAVELSLKWLSNVQSRDGRWDASDYGAGLVDIDEQGVKRNFAGREADTGITALVTLSFLGAGYTHEDGRYALNVDRALDWLIRQQASDGSLAGNGGHYAGMYCHAMATYALAEALGMQNNLVLGPIVDPGDIATGTLITNTLTHCLLQQQGFAPFAIGPATALAVTTNADTTGYGLRRVDDIRLRAALLRAITFTLSQQDPDSGGWRYEFGQEGDVSMFGWQMMSLKSAAIAGVRMNPTVRERMIRFLNSVRQGTEGGLFGYRRSVKVDGRHSEPVTPVMTAEALFCQQMLGYPRDSKASREAVQYLLQNMPRLSELNMYYWYYGTLAMYQYGGQPWEQWNRAVRDTLIGEQIRDGRLAGSWDPKGPWGRYGGRLYSTAISTLTLEVYYRLLPLYRMNETETGDASER